MPELALTLREIAGRIGAELQGDGSVPVRGVAGIESAGPDQVTFVANAKYAGQARTTRAAAVLVEPEFPLLEQVATLRVRNPYLAFARVLDLFYTPPAYPPGVQPTPSRSTTRSRSGTSQGEPCRRPARLAGAAATWR